MSKRIYGRLLAAVTGIVILHRLGSRRGASEAEVRRSFPGDELLPEAMVTTTHAVTMHAPPEAIWPWLVQAGYHRGGWYSDSAIDRFLFEYFWKVIAPADKKPEYRPSADRILPQFQDLKAGDILPDGPPDTAYFTVKALERNRHMVLYSDSHHRSMTPDFLRGTRLEPDSEFSWVFALTEVAPGRSRLIIRSRINLRPLVQFILLWPFLMLGEAIFPCLILQGIKERVERTAASVS